MTKSNRLKKLANIRLVLSAIAVLLAITMVFSGVKHFGHKPPTDDPGTYPTGVIVPGETEPGYTDYFPGPVAEEDDKQRDSGPGYDGKKPGHSTGDKNDGTENNGNDTSKDDSTVSGGGSGLGGIGNDHGVPDDPAERPDNNNSSENTGNENTGNENTGNNNTGNENTGNNNTGNENTGNENTGNENTGNNNTGNENTGNNNTGNENTGNNNTGNNNTGNNNTGNNNTGNENTGNNNTSNENTGNNNTGNNNTGNENTGNNNTGNNNTGNNNTGNDYYDKLKEYWENASQHHNAPSYDQESFAASASNNSITISFLSGDLSGIPIDPAAGTTGETENTAPTGTSVQTEPAVQEETTVLTEALVQTETAAANSLVGTDSAPKEKDSNIWGILFWGSAGLLALDLIAILAVSREIEVERKRSRRTKKRRAGTAAAAQQSAPEADATSRMASAETAQSVQKMSTTQRITPVLKVGTVHQPGRREHQQDSLAHTAVLNNTGIIAVVADGMGGLSGGEMVSQKIVMDTLAMARQLRPGQTNGVLYQMLDAINENVNRLLGPEGLYKSGSTMVAILAHEGKFQWISVGDSRIYLYRQGYANQLNHDHDQLQVWMADVLSGRRNLEETLRNPDGRKLTSFIGMGQLKYIDGSRCPIPLEAGDRLVLMSDGVYNMISEDALADILKRYPDVEQAAAVIDRVIREGNHPHQDNYTAIILGF